MALLSKLFFFQSLQAINNYYQLEYQFYYWRTLAGLEVDFIVYGAKGFYAFEIKRSRTVTKNDLKALKAFKEDFPEVTLYLIYGGERRYYFDEIEVLPMTEALKQLPQILTSEKA